MKKTLVISIVVLMMAALGANVVAAQEPDNAPNLGDRGPRDGGVIQVISDATGLTPQEIMQALQEDGATLASVIEANGGDVEAVKATLIENATARLDEASANLEQHIDDLLNSEAPLGRGPDGIGDGQRLDNLAEVLGIDADTLRQNLMDGQTVAQIAEANGVDVQTVIDALVSAAQDRIDAAVEAGHLNADNADTLKANLVDRITQFVNNTGENVPGFGGLRDGRGPGGRGPGGRFGGPDGNGGPAGNGAPNGGQDTAPQQNG